MPAARAVQIAPASVLIFDKTSSSAPVNAALVGLSAGGKPIDLGSASSYVNSCSADRRFLACVDKGRFRLWRFAN